MLVCLKCNEIYDKDWIRYDTQNRYNFCPKHNCSGEVADIDEELLSHITLLNNKGYITDFCCQGHIYNETPNVYILFRESYEFSELPKGFIRDPMPRDERTCLRYYAKGKTTTELMKEFAQARIDLYEWIEKLEEIK